MHKKRTHSKMLIEEIQVEHNAAFENITKWLHFVLLLFRFSSKKI